MKSVTVRIEVGRVSSGGSCHSSRGDSSLGFLSKGLGSVKKHT